MFIAQILGNLRCRCQIQPPEPGIQVVGAWSGWASRRDVAVSVILTLPGCHSEVVSRGSTDGSYPDGRG